MFLLASTSPLALEFSFVTSRKQSHHFSSFADLLRNFGKTRLKCKNTLGSNSSQMSAVVAGKSTKARSCVHPIWKQNENPESLNCCDLLISTLFCCCFGSYEERILSQSFFQKNCFKRSIYFFVNIFTNHLKIISKNDII